MGIQRKLFLIRCAIGLVWAALMAAWIVGAATESQILRGRSFARTDSDQLSIDVKGKIYFVSRSQYDRARGSEIVFGSSGVVLAFLILGAKNMKPA